MSRDIADELARSFQTSARLVVSVYLFGSHSEGANTMRAMSTLASFSIDGYGTSKERFDARLRLIGDIGRALRRNDVNLVVLNDAPLERLPDFRNVIIHE